MNTNIRADHERLKSNLTTIQKIFSAKELSKTLGISQNTWTNRMREPWRSFSYDDFRMISKHTRIDFTLIMEGSVAIR